MRLRLLKGCKIVGGVRAVSQRPLLFWRASFLLMLPLSVAAAWAGHSSRDRSVGPGGRVFLPKGFSALALVLQPDGKLVAAGSSRTAFALPRYNPVGGLDPTFGKGGIVTTKIGPRDAVPVAVLVKPDGKIVAAGESAGLRGHHGFAVARYNPNGSLDRGFGSGGVVTTPPKKPGTELYGGPFARQHDGKLIVVGSVFAADGQPRAFELVRYQPDGRLDPSFGSAGQVATAIGPIGAEATALVVQPDGKVVVAGGAAYVLDVGGQRFYHVALVRYRPDGTLDRTFGAGGKVTTATGEEDRANAVALQKDGKIVIAGSSDDEAFVVVRYTRSGAIDRGFGARGIVKTRLDSPDGAESLVVQPDGKLVVAGSVNTGSAYAFALVRYRANGAVDTSFGVGGRALARLGGEANGLVLQSDGKLVVVGGTNVGTRTEFALARFNPNGTLDHGFGKDGKVAAAVENSRGGIAAVVVQPDGKIVAAGGSAGGITLMRYLP